LAVHRCDAVNLRTKILLTENLNHPRKRKRTVNQPPWYQLQVLLNATVVLMVTYQCFFRNDLRMAMPERLEPCTLRL
jgi:hypothetical protein